MITLWLWLRIAAIMKGAH